MFVKHCLHPLLDIGDFVSYRRCLLLNRSYHSFNLLMTGRSCRRKIKRLLLLMVLPQKQQDQIGRIVMSRSQVDVTAQKIPMAKER